ncbi:hypothetical protein FPANT_9081 [Fusarium pseudoanthophilum]|uniref:Uncharacterized protein n=1 Tax=Fusarium pseudoanthophilum TaxID=48495 RepID=A0A8H5NWB3_9HYPO|nr:hypothetical protein FPANT_9081 [Fusarium pseudoanthophilum]
MLLDIPALPDSSPFPPPNMIVTPSVKETLRTSLQHITQFSNLQQRFDIFKQELATLGERLYSYGRIAPPNSKLYDDIWALRRTILGHRQAMKTLVIGMNDYYKGFNGSRQVAATQPIFSMRDGEELRVGSPELQAYMLVTGFEAQWVRVNGMWNQARGFAAEVDYLGNCCAQGQR